MLLPAAVTFMKLPDGDGVAGSNLEISMRCRSLLRSTRYKLSTALDSCRLPARLMSNSASCLCLSLLCRFAATADGGRHRPLLPDCAVSYPLCHLAQAANAHLCALQLRPMFWWQSYQSVPSIARGVLEVLVLRFASGPQVLP